MSKNLIYLFGAEICILARLGLQKRGEMYSSWVNILRNEKISKQEMLLVLILLGFLYNVRNWLDIRLPDIRPWYTDGYKICGLNYFKYPSDIRYMDEYQAELWIFGLIYPGDGISCRITNLMQMLDIRSILSFIPFVHT